MDYTVYVIALNDPRLSREAERQARARRGVKAVLKFNARTSMDDICRGIRQQTLPGSTSRLKKLHICAHGNLDFGYVEIGTGLRAAQTTSFRIIRPCWITTGQVAIGAGIEMNVCSASGFGMRPVMMGLANDAGVPVRACEHLIPIPQMFTYARGWRMLYPTQGNGISRSDYIQL